MQFIIELFTTLYALFADFVTTAPLPVLLATVAAFVVGPFVIAAFKN